MDFKIIVAICVVIVLAVVYFIYFNLGPNEECRYDMQCTNGACGRGTAADGAPTVCCPSGEHSTYGLYHYCTNMPSKADCWSDAMCASGHCGDNFGGTQKGYCSGDFVVGDSCKFNNDCANKACGRPTAAESDDENLICCPSGHEEYASANVKSYCTNMADGAVCLEDTQCAGGTCRGNCTGSCRGTCTGNKQAGELCDWDTDCSNRACGFKLNESGDKQMVCCPSGQQKVEPGDSRSWCTGAAVGERCSWNNNCANDACGRETADESNNNKLICCPSGKVVQSSLIAGARDYCSNMPSGTACYSDASCASGECDGNAYGAQKGICR